MSFSSINAQQPQTPQEQSDEVVRVNTDLVQAGVMVFDKQGRFVDGLKREQFELVIDGKPQPIAFFEQVRAGSAQEEARLSAGRPQAPSNAAATDNRVANTTAVQQTKITVE